MSENKAVIIKEYKKAIVVCGETKPIKDGLKNLGGKWYGKLIGEDGIEFCGWMFAGSKRSIVEEFLNERNTLCTTQTPFVSPSKIQTRTKFDDWQQEVLDRLSRLEDRLSAMDKTMASWVMMQSEEYSSDK